MYLCLTSTYVRRGSSDREKLLLLQMHNNQFVKRSRNYKANILDITYSFLAMTRLMMTMLACALLVLAGMSMRARMFCFQWYRDLGNPFPSLVHKSISFGRQSTRPDRFSRWLSF